MPAPLHAQPAPPPLPAPQPGAAAPAEQTQPDPPSRVGRVAAITGTASFHGQNDTQWTPLSVNFPVSAGNAFWTEPNAQMRLEISDSLIAMAPATEFDVHALDQTGMQGVAARGEVYLDLRNIGPDEAWIVQTPRGLVKLNSNGRYGIVVGTTDDPTLVTVIEGSASVESPGFSLTIEPNQAARLTGTDTFQGVIQPARRDAFLIAMLGRDRPPPARLPPQVAETITAMPGGDDMASVGSWSDAPEYGQVWYPPVDPGWVPYRHGHWAYVAPWGWTWIDDASWGFAPFHYGRWVELGGRWAWTPGAIAVHERPVYAPALVAFIGLGAGVAIGAALASGSIGWVPLGPREAYHPWYHTSDTYVRQVNAGHVSNITTVNNVTVNTFANRAAITAVPAAAMAASRPVAALARPVTAQQLATARPVFGQQPLQPTATTAGVTPAVATRLNIAPQVGGRAIVPGPAIRPMAAGVQGAAVRAPVVPGPGVVRGPAPAAAVSPLAPAVRPAVQGASPLQDATAPPTGAAARHSGPPSAAVPAAHPAQPLVAQPGPAVNRPSAQPVAPRPVVQPHFNPQPQQAAPRPVPQPAAQPHFNPPPQQAAPRPVPQPAAQPRFNPPPQQAAPRPAPQPAAQPHAAPHPNPPAQEREKKPGER